MEKQGSEDSSRSKRSVHSCDSEPDDIPRSCSNESVSQRDDLSRNMPADDRLSDNSACSGSDKSSAVSTSESESEDGTHGQDENQADSMCGCTGRFSRPWGYWYYESDEDEGGDDDEEVDEELVSLLQNEEVPSEVADSKASEVIAAVSETSLSEPSVTEAAESDSNDGEPNLIAPKEEQSAASELTGEPYAREPIVEETSDRTETEAVNETVPPRSGRIRSLKRKHSDD